MKNNLRLITVISSTLLLVACSKGDGAPGGAGPGGMPPTEVAVITVTRATVPVTVELPGRLQAVRTAQIRARVEGIVEKRLFREGSDVKQGDVLFKLDSRTLSANHDMARAAFARAKADALVARQTAERYKALLNDNAVSKQEYDQVIAREAQTQADMLAAEAGVRRAQVDLGYATVTAPISGWIGRALVTEGALVGKGEATHLATVEQTNPIWANFSQTDTEIYRLRKAHQSGKTKVATLPVELILEDGSVYPQKGKLLFTDLTVDPATGAVVMRAEFLNPGKLLLSGQFVRVRLSQTQADSMIVIPQRAVQAMPQGQMVMLVGPENKVMPRPIKTGGLSGDGWIVTEGLQEGDQVIVEGIQKARPGSPVSPIPFDPKVKPLIGVPPGAAAPGADAQPQPKSESNGKPPEVKPEKAKTQKTSATHFQLKLARQIEEPTVHTKLKRGTAGLILAMNQKWGKE